MSAIIYLGQPTLPPRRTESMCTTWNKKLESGDLLFSRPISSAVEALLKLQHFAKEFFSKKNEEDFSRQTNSASCLLHPESISHHAGFYSSDTENREPIQKKELIVQGMSFEIEESESELHSSGEETDPAPGSFSPERLSNLFKQKVKYDL